MPFLLQAFVTAPNLVEGDPNPRLLTLAKLLVQGARLNGSAKAAAVASQVIQDIMLVSVCRGFHTDKGTGTLIGSCFRVAVFCILKSKTVGLSLARTGRDCDPCCVPALFALPQLMHPHMHYCLLHLAFSTSFDVVCTMLLR